MVQLEAMLCGRPVVSTDVPTGVPWVNVHGETGFVVPAGDVASLRGALERLVADADLRQALGAAARQRVLKMFTADSMCAATLALYHEPVRSWRSAQQAGTEVRWRVVRQTNLRDETFSVASTCCADGPRARASRCNPRPWRAAHAQRPTHSSRCRDAPSVLDGLRTPGRGVPSPPHTTRLRGLERRRERGCLCIAGRRLGGAQGRVLAFEPNPDAARVLTENVRLNGLQDRVEIVPWAIGETPGDANLYASGADGMSRLGRANPALAATRAMRVAGDDARRGCQTGVRNAPRGSSWTSRVGRLPR